MPTTRGLGQQAASTSNLAAVDGNWFLHRAHHVMGNSRNPAKRIPLLVASFICADAVRVQAPYVAVCFDGPRSFRYDIYPEYKKSRHKDSEGTGEGEIEERSPYEYLEATIALLGKLGIFVIQQAKFEADDLLASFAHRFAKQFRRIYLITHDKDLVQCLSDTVLMHIPPHKALDALTLDVDGAVKKWSLQPTQMRDYQTLIGDSGDDVPPISGMTNKKARRLIEQYGSLRAFLKTKEGAAYWKEHSEELMRNRALVSMSHEAVPVEVTLDHLRVNNVPDNALRDLKVPASYYQLRELAHPRTKSLFG